MTPLPRTRATLLLLRKDRGKEEMEEGHTLCLASLQREETANYLAVTGIQVL